MEVNSGVSSNDIIRSSFLSFTVGSLPKNSLDDFMVVGELSAREKSCVDSHLATLYRSLFCGSTIPWSSRWPMCILGNAHY